MGVLVCCGGGDDEKLSCCSFLFHSSSLTLHIAADFDDDGKWYHYWDCNSEADLKCVVLMVMAFCHVISLSPLTSLQQVPFMYL